jgi:hypothetical protein
VLPLRAGPLVRALEWRWLALIGVASYSLYLWHLPVLNALGGTLPALLLLGTPLCLAIAFASYRLVEAPAATAGRARPSRSARNARLRGRKDPTRPKPRSRRRPRPEQDPVGRERCPRGRRQRPSRGVKAHAHLHDAGAAGGAGRVHAFDRSDAPRPDVDGLVRVRDRGRADHIGPELVGLVAAPAAGAEREGAGA